MFASLSTQYAQLRIKGSGLSVVQYFDYTFKNLNGIRDTTLSKRLLVPKTSFIRKSREKCQQNYDVMNLNQRFTHSFIFE